MSVKCTDESLLLGDTFEICFKNITAAVELLTKLVFTIHSGIIFLASTNVIMFLGFVKDSVNMETTLIDDK